MLLSIIQCLWHPVAERRPLRRPHAEPQCPKTV